MAKPNRDPATDAALARLYDLDLVDDPGDLDLYLALAGRTGGPILELAAGSGRVALPLARAGYEVTAIDIDPAMLARTRRKLEEIAKTEPGVADRIHLVEGDLVGLELPGSPRFGLAVFALNSILLLDSRDKQRAALETMARHLAPGGLAVVDVWLPSGPRAGPIRRPPQARIRPRRPRHGTARDQDGERRARAGTRGHVESDRDLREGPSGRSGHSALGP
jgi:SAM-dependent methyltransferase